MTVWPNRIWRNAFNCNQLLAILITRSTSPTGLLMIAIEYQKKKKLLLQQGEKLYYYLQLILLYRLIAGKKRVFLLIQIYYLPNLIDYALNNKILRNLIVLLLLRYVSRSRLIKSMLINDLNVNMVSNARFEPLISGIKLVLLYLYLIVPLLIISDYLGG